MTLLLAPVQPYREYRVKYHCFGPFEAQKHPFTPFNEGRNGSKAALNTEFPEGCYLVNITVLHPFGAYFLPETL